MSEPTKPASTPDDLIDSASIELTEDEQSKISGGGIPGESMDAKHKD
jgi:hypothetical protein